MGLITDRLAGHKLIGLDTVIFIYHLQAHDRYLSLTKELLNGVRSGRWRAVTSTVTIMELTVRPWQVNRPAVAYEYEALLVHFPNCMVADVTRDIARRAAQLRARYRLRPADALQVATALNRGATAWVTNDHALTRLAPDLEVVILDDFVVADEK